MQFTQDFKIIPTEDLVRGVYYNMSKRSFVFVGRHETEDEIIHTCEHETIHGILDYIIEEDELLIDEQQEHYVIRNMMWSDYSLV